MSLPNRDVVDPHITTHRACIVQLRRSRSRWMPFGPASGDLQRRCTPFREPPGCGRPFNWHAFHGHHHLAGVALLLAAAAGPASALPVFTAAWGLDTTNAPFDATLFGNDPVTGGDSRTVSWPYDRTLDFYSTAAAANADQGVVGVLARISVARNTSLQTARVESVASMKGSVNLCAPGSAPGVCTPPAPGAPIPIPYPNFYLSTTNTQTGSHALGLLSVVVSINGDAVDSQSLTGVSGLQTLGPANGATTGMFTSTGAFEVKFDIAAIVTCSTTGCVAEVDASHSLSFVEGAPAFLGLPDGWTVWSEDLNIVDNRWTDPRVTSAPPPPSADVPAAATLPLSIAGLAAFAVRRRRPVSAVRGQRCFNRDDLA